MNIFTIFFLPISFNFNNWELILDIIIRSLTGRYYLLKKGGQVNENN